MHPASSGLISPGSECEALILAAACSAVIIGWRLVGAGQCELSGNGRQIAVANGGWQGVDERRQAGEKFSATAVARAGARGAAAAASKATNCALPRPSRPSANMQVTVGCVGAPVNTCGAGAYPGDKVAAQAALVDRSAWEVYALGLEVVLAGCSTRSK